MRPPFSSDGHDLARVRTRQRPEMPLSTSGDTFQLVASRIFLPITVAVNVSDSDPPSEVRLPLNLDRAALKASK